MNSYLEQSLAICQELGVRFAAKFVRGAYLQHERSLAESQNRPDPLHPTPEATSTAYDWAVSEILHRLKQKPGSVALSIATHNEQSVWNAVQLYATSTC